MNGRFGQRGAFEIVSFEICSSCKDFVEILDSLIVGLKFFQEVSRFDRFFGYGVKGSKFVGFIATAINFGFVKG